MGGSKCLFTHAYIWLVLHYRNLSMSRLAVTELNSSSLVSWTENKQFLRCFLAQFWHTALVGISITYPIYDLVGSFTEAVTSHDEADQNTLKQCL